MRPTLIIFVLIIKFIYCAHIGFSENDNLQNMEKNKDLEWFETYKAILPNPVFQVRKGSVGTTEKQFLVNLPNPYNQVTSSLKEKRCSKWARLELFDKLTPKKFQKTSIKELVGAKYKKRCDTCRESTRCKIQGKCDLCNRYCKDVDSTTLPSPTSAPLVGSIQAYLEDDTSITEQSPNDITPFEKSGRYYTLGAFGPGPKQNLIVRLMNVAKKKSLDKLVVLAKPKGKVEDENLKNPIIIDTANAFQTDDNHKEIQAALHSVTGNTFQQIADLDLTSKIDRELDAAIAEKQKVFGKSYLTNNEIDKIIDKVLSTVNSSPQPQLERDMVELGSRFNVINPPHITTKRSVSNWALNRNREEPFVGAEEQNKELVPQPEIHQPILRSNKRTATNSNSNDFLNKFVGSPREENNYKSDSYLSEDDYTETKRNAEEDLDDSSETGQDLLEYEPAPPTYLDDINQPVHKETVFKNHSSPDSENQEKANIINIPISSTQKLESASQRFDGRLRNNPLTEVPAEEPVDEFQTPDDLNDDQDAIVTLTQAPDTYDSNNNESDPIVGSNWFTDELEQAKHWWRANVGSKAPSNFSNETQDSESKVNIINPNQFTVILKNLEQKVENIADLVKKTCGKANSKDENVGEEAPKFLEEEKSDKPKSNAASRNTIQEINVPEDDDTTTTENVTPAPPSRNHPPNIIDSAVRDLDRGTDYLINKAVKIADRLQDGVLNPKRTEAKPILEAVPSHTVGAANADRKIFSVDDPSVGCSKEDSGEYLSKAPTNNEDNQDPTVACSKEDSEEYVGEKLKNKEDPPQQSRSAFKSDSATAPEKPEEEVGCSKEDSEEYLGKQQNPQPDAESPKSDDTENVACSKESDEYVGEADRKHEEVPEPSREKTHQKPFLSNIKSDNGQFGSPSKTQEIPPKDEEVEDRKKKFEENVGDQKEENTDQTALENEDAVGCKKDDDDEYIIQPVYNPHGYNSYRESNSKPKSDSPISDLPKHKLPHLPALNNLFHRNHPKEGSLLNPLQKPILQPSRLLHRDEDVPAPAKKSKGIFNPEDKFSNIPSDNHKFDPEPVNPNFPQNMDPFVDPKQREHSIIPGSKDFQPEPNPQQFRKMLPLNDEPENLPSVRQHLNKILSPASLDGRFGENPIEDPKTFQNWPQREDVVGAKKDLDTNEDLKANTDNPFTIFGKVVPQLNNTEVSFHHIPNDKIYFLGTGMQLPLNMKKDKDGAYQLSVDIDKLCSNCKEKSCNKKGNNEELPETDKQNEFGNEQVGMQAPPPLEEIKEGDDNRTVNDEDDENDPPVRNNPAAPQKLTPHKFEIVTQDLPTSGISKSNRILNDKTEIAKEPQLFEQGANSKKKFKFQPLFHVDPKKEKRHSKRSPSLDVVFPSLTNNNDPVNTKDLDGRKNEGHQRNSIHSLDESLKKIDDNMKRYFDRRQKLEEFHKDQVRRNLEEQDEGKDIVKRRVKLVNNVLAWMKSIAVENP